MGGTVYITAWSAWSPGIGTGAEWREWADGQRSLVRSREFPPLAHVDPLFKRRFSQLTRMTIQTGHEALAGLGPMKASFSSVYGEIGQQFKITARLVAENEVSPANFSLSVFNTPVAALSISEQNTAGYVACYPGPDSFRQGFLEAAAAVLSGAEPGRLFIAADELLPDEYAPLQDGVDQPYALALVLSAEPGQLGAPRAVAVDLDAFGEWKADGCKIPEALVFLREWILADRAAGFRR